MPIQRFLQRLVWACLVPPFVLAVALALARLHDRYQGEVTSAQRLSANLLSNLENLLLTRIEALQVLASLSAGPGALPLAAQYRLAQGFHETFGSHILLATLDRRMLYNTQRPLGSDLPEVRALAGRSAWDIAVSTGNPAVGDMFVGQLANAPVVALVIPVKDAGRVSSLLITVVPTAELQRVMDRWRLPPDMAFTLVDSAGQTIAHRSPSAGRTPEDASSGNAFRVASAPTGWTLVAFVQGWSVPSKLSWEAAQLLVLFALTTALAFFAARRGGRHLADAVASLAESGQPPRQPAREIREIAEVRQRLDSLAAQRDAAEADVRQSETRLRRLLAAIHEPVWISIDRRVVFANVAAERLVGLSIAQMQSRPLAHWMDHSSRRRLRKLLPLVRTGEANIQIDDVVFPAAGPTRRSLLVTGVWLDLPGGRAALTVARDISELQRTRSALELSHKELTGLVARLNTVEEAERRRIGRELHDDLQQHLGATAVELEQAEVALASGATRAAAAPLQRALALTITAIDSVRRIVRSLRPLALDELGLYAALEVLANDFNKYWGLQTECELIGAETAEREVPAHAATCLYRIAQEALNNVRKHAQASFAHLSLDLMRPGEATLIVVDDGRGFDEAAIAAADAYGLLGMRERVRPFGGSVHISSTAAGGTRVEVRIAWDATAALPPPLPPPLASAP
jgi:PAS domain S-box-containing protein